MQKLMDFNLIVCSVVRLNVNPDTVKIIKVEYSYNHLKNEYECEMMYHVNNPPLKSPFGDFEVGAC